MLLLRSGVHRGSQGLWFHPDIDRAASVQDWILYGIDARTKTSGTLEACHQLVTGYYAIAAGAPGSKATALPSDVAMKLPGAGGGLMLQVHYYNAAASVVQDASGVTFCTAFRRVSRTAVW